MNCKPGDLAVIVARSANYGRIVNVVRRYAGELIEGSDYHMVPDVVYWVVEANGAHLVVKQDFGPELACRQHVVRDERLRPIRDPGEDAKDETLQWKEVPTKQKEPA
jgi:hypothetical protein